MLAVLDMQCVVLSIITLVQPTCSVMYKCNRRRRQTFAIHTYSKTNALATLT